MGGGGWHGGPALLHTFLKQKKINPARAPRHIGRSSQWKVCNKNGIFYQWIQNDILPHFDPRISSLGLLGAKIIPKRRTMAIIITVFFMVVAVV